MTHIVVIGAGQAGVALAAKLRALGFAGQVTMIGDEPVPPYQRPPLSKGYLLGDVGVDRLTLRGDAFYADSGITLRLGAAVDAIDPAAQNVTLGDEVIAYDQLALTTGSIARQLPTELEGVYTVRTLADVDAMRDEFVAGRRVVIVGGGYIGLEAAAVAAKLGLHVTVLEAAPRILQRVACAETATFFRDLHASHGVRIIEGTALDRLVGDTRVIGVQLSDGGILPADFVIAGVGILPATALAEGAGVALDNGIAVDGQGRTSVAGIWAAGDCASFPWRGGRLRLESVPNAIEQAELVAENMLGGSREHVPTPWFWSDQYDVKLQIAGLGAGYDRIVTRATKGAVSFWYYRGAELLAVDAANDPRAFMVGKRLLEAGRSPDPDLLANTADLKALLK